MKSGIKAEVLGLIDTVKKAHDVLEISSAILQEQMFLQILQDCQQCAIALGNLIEISEGEGFITITLLENYCEVVYQMFCAIQEGDIQQAQLIKNEMVFCLDKVKNSIEKDIKEKKAIVFLPYKASMWDSMESIWLAAKDDENYNTYVVPIPYYEKNEDGDFTVEHYEGNQFPDYVKVIPYEQFPLESMKPDVVYIHNPYDHGNYVTSIHPRFYSYELKKHTDCLVYVPYFATSGGMSEGQALCSAYQNVDYMVVQAEKYKDYIDPIIPRKKILPFGSPKFDRVLQFCNNPPQPPKEWIAKMEGKKIYFFNTSINGMLGDTRRFLLKMEYVFKCFRDRQDACLVWRPHPLLESTFESMRKAYRPVYDSLKKYFLEHELGIYDDTPDMEKTIALCDAYVGDEASSVLAMFGIAGKPIFVLNNNVHSLPSEDDWRGEIIKSFWTDTDDKWRVTQGNKLYYSPQNDYNYKFYCNLSDYTQGEYYQKAYEINGKIYVCPQNAQDILVVEDRKIKKVVKLTEKIRRKGAFLASLRVDNYLFLIPNQYPAIVRYDIKREEVDYLENCNHIFMKNVGGNWKAGGFCLWDRYIFLSSPTDNKVLAVDVNTLKPQLLEINYKNKAGYCGLYADGHEVWMTPLEGTTVVRWNPATGEVCAYEDMPKNLECKQRPLGFRCEMRPFTRPAITRDEVIFSPNWGNMFVRIDKKSGKVEQWKPLLDIPAEEKNGYYMSSSRGWFCREKKDNTWIFYCEITRKLYEINIKNGEWTEQNITFDVEELKREEAGFAENSEWLQYCLVENVFNTLPDFLSGEIKGNAFDEARQRKAYAQVSANCKGTTGEMIHQFISKNL